MILTNVLGYDRTNKQSMGECQKSKGDGLYEEVWNKFYRAGNQAEE